MSPRTSLRPKPYLMCTSASLPTATAAAMQLVAREFANRYLESVGVRPSRATLDLVHRNVALGEEHIRATLRVGGCGLH